MTQQPVTRKISFTVDIKLYREMNAAYRSFFSTDPPARSCVKVSALPDAEAPVEIKVIGGR